MKKLNCEYILKARIVYYSSISGELEFQNIEQKFSDENPINAREAAFNAFDNYVHTLLLGIGLKENELNGITDREIRKHLNQYIHQGTTSKLNLQGEEFEFSDYIGRGIWIEMIIENDSENRLIIHSINHDNSDMPGPVSLFELEEEFAFYQDNDYDVKNYAKTVSYYDWEEHMEGYPETALGVFKILETPFDWTGYDKINWWLNPSENESRQHEPNNENGKLLPPMEIAFAKGEHEYCEFKPGMINLTTSTRNIEYEIAKAICAFSNSLGGYLFIGVGDKGNKVHGLDFTTISTDEFLREFTRIKTMYLPKFISFSTYGGFYTIDNKTVFIITVHPSSHDPVFLFRKDENGKLIKEFYVRADAASRHIYDIEEIVKYCKKRWSKNN